MVYKIALVSTHGTGKTSLAGLIEGELKRRGIEARALREVSRQAKERGLPINEQTTKEAQLWIQYRTFADELFYGQPRYGSEYEVTISDRGPENYCYLKHRFGEDDFALQLTLGHVQRYPYDQIYLLPIVNGKIKNDGGRSIDPIFQKVMDEEIRMFLQEHKIRHHELPLPKENDYLRNEWVKIIVNQTILDLKKPEELLIP